MQKNNLVYIFIVLSCFIQLNASSTYPKIDFITFSSYVGDGTRNDAKPLILDTRDLVTYKHSHVPSAQPLPYDMFEMFYYPTFANHDLNKLVVLYAQEANDESLHSVIEQLKNHGHTNVMIYSNGFDEWKAKNYLETYTSFVKKYHKKNDAYFIDARVYEKYANGTIVGSINITPEEFHKKSIFLPADKSVRIIVYGSDYQSKEANIIASKLYNKGYTNVNVFGAGFGAWKRKKFETVKVLNCSE